VFDLFDSLFQENIAYLTIFNSYRLF